MSNMYWLLFVTLLSWVTLSMCSLDQESTSFHEWLCAKHLSLDMPIMNVTALENAVRMAFTTSCEFTATSEHPRTQKLIFFKSHKTASSTLELMVARAAKFHSMTDLDCELGNVHFNGRGCSHSMPS